ncbi:2-oxoacid:acceptor oxidoreductase family protein [Thermodesulfobacteriota bacterium]
MSSLYEIVWHGRGGQGAVTAAKLLTEAAYYQGFKGVSAKPTYFSERRGAPVSVHTRVSSDPIRTFANVSLPNIAVVLDDNLLEMVNITDNLQEGGLVIINSPADPDDLGIDGPFSIAVSDAFHSSEAAGLIVEGNVLISTSILGPFAASSNLVDVPNIERAISNKFSGKALERNLEAFRLAYEGTQVRRWDNARLSAGA